jgi:hypothetical protein
MIRRSDDVNAGLGVPARRLAVALSAPSPRADHRAVGFPLQSLTRNASSTAIAVLGTCLGLVGCSHIDDLKNRSWIITKGEYLNQPIAFDAPTGFRIADLDGNVHIYLGFHESGSTILPGIKSDDLYGQWRAEGNTVTLTLDSAKYEHIRSSAVSQLRFNSAMADSTFTTEPDTSGIDDPIGTGRYTEVMKIYRNPFTVDIDGDELVLRSSTTTIRARMDHTVEKLFEGL